MEKRLIDATKLLQVLDRNFGSMGEVLQQLIVVQSTVEAVPVVHGKWIELGFSENERYGFICSICHNDVAASKNIPITEFKYCSSCGTKMDLEG